MELQRERELCQKLRADLTQRDELLSQDVAELLRDGRLTSVLHPSSDSERPSTPNTMLTQAETRVRMLEYEKECLAHDQMVRHELPLFSSTVNMIMINDAGQGRSRPGGVCRLTQDFISLISYCQRDMICIWHMCP